MMRLAFITDEVTQNFDEAIRFAKENGLDGLELRTVDNTPIDSISPETLHKWKAQLDAVNLCVCGIASSFYKCAPEESALDTELDKLKRLCTAAEILGCEYIRGFAFFAPESGPLSPEMLAPYFERPVQLMEQYGKTLLLEADPSVNTSNHATLAKLIEAIDSPRVRAIYDPGNDLYDPLGETPYPDGYDAIQPYFVHVHIKDAVRAEPESYCVKVGTGEVDYAALLSRLVNDGYSGWLSMETHYRLAAKLTEDQMRLPGGSLFSEGGAAATAESVTALKKLLAEVKSL